MSKVQVDTIDTRSGTSTMQIGSTNTTTINLGVSGDTVNIPSGVTIANAGTATGFGVAGTEIAVARRSGNQTAIPDNVFTKLAFNSDVYDPDSNFDTSNNRYIAPTDGRYYFSAQAYLWGTVDSVHSRFYKNGTAQNDTYWIDSGSYTGTREFTVRSVAIFNLSANDYIELYVKGNTTSGTTVADEVGTQFLAFRLD